MTSVTKTRVLCSGSQVEESNCVKRKPAQNGKSSDPWGPRYKQGPQYENYKTKSLFARGSGTRDRAPFTVRRDGFVREGVHLRNLWLLPDWMINCSSRFAVRGGGFVKIDYLNKINGHYRGVQMRKDFS